ncbi:hypothetical protein ANCCAN_23893 [Ancylostoma caninum]|uniref:DUF4708 domain-containing protein n=1 Tax=Ancylostoma caninum TaxID=29170 RepID=A0A368FDS8_ANCCA|nr:hypothetical protein ANCCAN_23893 [Ancylostoma caninum]
MLFYRLGRGQLVGKHSCLPPDCGFATYGEMRAYWKNCYGYDLPSKEPAAYYDIWYNGINNSFLYPDFCVMSSEPMPIQFRDEYILTRRASEEFFSAFVSGKHMICGVAAQLATVDPKLISLSVRPLGSESQRRRISSLKPALSHPHGKSFLMDLITSTDDPSSTGKFEEEPKAHLRSIGPTVGSSLLPEATPSLSTGTPSFAMIPRTTKTPQKLLSSMSRVGLFFSLAFHTYYILWERVSLNIIISQALFS